MHDPNTPPDLLATALQELRSKSETADLANFEHGVWSEIALRDQRSRKFPFPRLPFPAAAAFAVIAIVAGASTGLFQAGAYERQTALTLEQRYVESIHPVMMSATHDASAHR